MNQRKTEFLTALVYSRQPLPLNADGQPKPTANIGDIAKLLGINRAILDGWVKAKRLLPCGRKEYLIADVVYLMAEVVNSGQRSAVSGQLGASAPLSDRGEDGESDAVADVYKYLASRAANAGDEVMLNEFLDLMNVRASTTLSDRRSDHTREKG